MEKIILTYHASPERAEIDELRRQKAIFENLPQLSIFLDAVPNDYLILNSNRQIVYANKRALEMLGYNSIDKLLGMRQGEAIKCMHSNEMAAGCGTSEACRQCGAVNATINGLNGIADLQECRITSEENDCAYDFRVWTTPYEVDGEKFAIMSITDISNEKRRSALERIFFHDVLNTAGGIQGISALIHDYPDEVDEFKDILFDSSNHLINEIQAQRDLINAENSDLKVHYTDLNTVQIVNFLTGLYRGHEIAKDKQVVAAADTINCEFLSDEALLTRVVGNMTKNALEASSAGQTVTVGCSVKDDKVIFSINNPKYMPREIQLQVFQRSFSTKGSGRGLGTYSMKLLSEKYLNGRVYFTSNNESGTTFYAEYPIKPNIV